MHRNVLFSTTLKREFKHVSTHMAKLLKVLVNGQYVVKIR